MAKIPQDAILYIVRHTGIHAAFGEDENLAKEGEIYSEDQILDAISQAEFDRLVALEAIEEPTPREIKAWREAQAEALKRQKALLAEIDDAQDAIEDAEDDLEEGAAVVDQTALDLEAQRAENARLQTQIDDLKAITKTQKAQLAAAKTQAVSPAAAKKPKNANPGVTANPELQAQNTSGNQTSDDPAITGTQTQETVTGDPADGAIAAT